jgi:hypothetical protein
VAVILIHLVWRHLDTCNISLFNLSAITVADGKSERVRGGEPKPQLSPVQLIAINCKSGGQKMTETASADYRYVYFFRLNGIKTYHNKEVNT